MNIFTHFLPYPLSFQPIMIFFIFFGNLPERNQGPSRRIMTPVEDEAVYKRAKEAFVADLHGTTWEETFLVFALMSVRNSFLRISARFKWFSFTNFEFITRVRAGFTRNS